MTWPFAKKSVAVRRFMMWPFANLWCGRSPKKWLAVRGLIEWPFAGWLSGRSSGRSRQIFSPHGQTATQWPFIRSGPPGSLLEMDFQLAQISLKRAIEPREQISDYFASLKTRFFLIFFEMTYEILCSLLIYIKGLNFKRSHYAHGNAIILWMHICVMRICAYYAHMWTHS